MNGYKLEAAYHWTLYGHPGFVTFTTQDQAKLPVPSPTYLAIHAACAKVAHLSGVTKCIAKLHRDMRSVGPFIRMAPPHRYWSTPSFNLRLACQI